MSNKFLTEAMFTTLTKDLPEDGFTTLVPIIYESFSKKRGRTLDPVQIASLAVGLMEMSATIDAQITMIGQLQQEVEECQQKKSKSLWRP